LGTAALMGTTALALILAAAALVIAAGAMLLWAKAKQATRRAALERVITGHLGQDQAGQGQVGPWRSEAPRLPAGPQGWQTLLLRAGVAATPALHARLAAVVTLAGLAAWLAGGKFAAAAAVALAVMAILFVLWMKAERRQRRMIAQLPGLLDAMVRLLTIGNSLGAAFQSAAAAMDEPLAEVLRRAESLARSGKDLDAALRQVSAQYRLQELYLVAAVMSVALRFGGRSDQVLERMALFMRDLEQARQELSAMSAEVRLSAWVLALLPVGIACLIILLNNSLFMGMWNDPAGFYMLIAAVVLQIAGSYWLYRMAKSV